MATDKPLTTLELLAEFDRLTSPERIRELEERALYLKRHIQIKLPPAWTDR